MLASKGDPKNSSNTSIIRCKHSRASKGSISVDEVRRKRRFAWMRLKTRVGGEVFGRYIRFGRGVECAT